MLHDMPKDYKISKVKRSSSQGKQDPHMHPYYEAFYLINGDCTFFIGHNIYKLNKGDLVIVPKGEIHKSTYPDKGFSERYVVSFRDNCLDWIKGIIGDDMVEQCMHLGVISIPEKRRAYLESRLNKLKFEAEEQDVLSPAFILNGITELILFVIRCHNYEENVIKEIDVNNQLIQSVATYIYENYDKYISLDDMADKFHISRSYLSKKFKAVTGFGFKEYVINVRIQKSCKLLLETEKSITDIAFECGFNDSNYFGDAFRRVKGISPNKYRKNNEAI